jgi:hypothetical protein
MLLIVLSSVTCPDLRYFSTLYYKRLDFRKRNVSENKMSFFRFYLQILSETFFNIIRIQWYIIIHADRFACKEHIFLVRLWKNFNFSSTNFRKILKYQISWKFVQWEPNCSMRTNTTMLIVAFRNFANAPKKCQINDRFKGQIKRKKITKSLYAG